MILVKLSLRFVLWIVRQIEYIVVLMLTYKIVKLWM